jgi:2-polyprenyl-3-methyl-5-hydroxy-6-metoxy-1,4-benzoquinol methylase
VKVNESIRVQETPLCMLCRCEGTLLYHGLRDPLYGAPGIWDLRQCPECSLAWLNPRPLDQEIEKLYQQYFTHNAANCGTEPGRCLRFVRNAVLSAHLGYPEQANSPLQKGLGTVLSLVGPIREAVELRVMTLEGRQKGKLLDVGCGSGRFLAEMRALGWEVSGVEPDGQAVRAARERFGLSVLEGTLEKASFPDDSFDAITMWHVIEHVLDPIGTVKECCRVLKPKGKLVAITPNIQSLGHRIFREAWRGLEIPRHFYVFSPQALQACVELAGLEVLELRTTARLARFMWAVSWLIRRNEIPPGTLTMKEGFWQRLGGLAYQMVEEVLCKVMNAGEEIILVATKRDE